MKLRPLNRTAMLVFAFACSALLPGASFCQESSAPARVEYVAMGSSYAAGPGIGTRAPGSPAQCSQSSENYAHLFARKRGLDLIDVSCSGATTQSILGSWRSLPPQLHGVTPKTRLVTITIGGNDVFWMANLTAWSCQNMGASAAACSPRSDAEVAAAFESLPGNLRKIVDGIRQVSPKARIVFVNYITLLPEKGSCPDKLALTGDELEKSRASAAKVATITESVAKQTGSDLLKASDVSKGHDVCSSDPWVNGYPAPDATSAFAPVPYHPRIQAMQAVADALDRMLPQF